MSKRLVSSKLSYVVASLLFISVIGHIVLLNTVQTENHNPNISVDSTIELQSDLVIRFSDDTCYGLYTTNKTWGMNSTVWICESGFIGYDSSGTSFPDPFAPTPSNLKGK